MKAFIDWCERHELVCHMVLWYFIMVAYSYIWSFPFQENSMPGVIVVAAGIWLIVAAVLHPFLMGVLRAIDSQGEGDE